MTKSKAGIKAEQRELRRCFNASPKPLPPARGSSTDPDPDAPGSFTVIFQILDERGEGKTVTRGSSKRTLREDDARRREPPVERVRATRRSRDGRDGPPRDHAEGQSRGPELVQGPDSPATETGAPLDERSGASASRWQRERDGEEGARGCRRRETPKVDSAPASKRRKTEEVDESTPEDASVSTAVTTASGEPRHPRARLRRPIPIRVTTASRRVDRVSAGRTRDDGSAHEPPRSASG